MCIRDRYSCNDEDIVVNLIMRFSSFAESFLGLMREQGIMSEFLWRMLYSRTDNGCLMYDGKEEKIVTENVKNLCEEILFEMCIRDSWKDSKRAKEAADSMKLTAADLKKAGIVERVFEEPEHFSKDQMEDVAEALRSQIDQFLLKYGSMDSIEPVSYTHLSML